MAGPEGSDPRPGEEDAIDEIVAGYLDRLNGGEMLDREEILREHPDHGRQILERLEIFQAVGAGSPPGAIPSDALGDYTLGRQIGRGGMGVVYEAWQNSMERRVALKVLPGGVAADPRACARFLREAQTAGRLQHPNVVSVFGMGVEAKTPYYAMEYVEGETLARILRRLREAGPDAATPFGGTREELAFYSNAAKAFAGVADGLQHAHSRGIIHRDIKPSNLILDAGGCLRILDFGLAHSEGQESLTGSGEFLGTPLYMSPEQARRRKLKVDHRTDIYSLGATLYEMLVGRPPFQGKDSGETLSQIIEREPAGPVRLNPRVPRDLETIVLKCIEKDPGDRYGTAEALAQDLRRFVRGDPIEGRPQPRWRRIGRRLWRSRRQLAAALLVAALVACGAWIFWQQHLSARRSDRDEHDRLVRGAVMKIELGRITSRKASAEMPFRSPLDLLNPRDLARLVGGEDQESLEVAGRDLERAARLSPDRPEALYHRARALRLLRKDKEALADLEEALRRRPDFPPARTLKELLLGRRRIVEAWRDGRVPGASPQYPWAAAWLETFLLREDGKWKEAARSYDALVPWARDEEAFYAGASIEVLLGRGISCLQAGEPKDALGEFFVARHLWPGSIEPPLLIGRCYAAMGDRAEAEVVFERLHGEWRDGDEAAFWIASVFRSLGDYEAALGWIGKVVDPVLREKLRAQTWLRFHRYQEACDAGERLVALAPEDVEAIFLLAWALTARTWIAGGEELDRRIALMEKVTGLEPRNALAWAKLGYECAFRNEFDRAVACCKKAIELDPEEISGTYFLAVVLGLPGGKPLEAMDLFSEKFYELARDNANLQRSIGIGLADLGKEEEALERFKRSVELDPDWRFSRMDVAATLARLGRYDEAAGVYREIQKRHPDLEASPGPLVHALLKAGRLEEAVSVARRSVEKYPRGRESNLALAWILEKKGDTEAAAEAILRAIEGDPASTAVHSAAARILGERAGAALPGGDLADRALEALEATAQKQDPGPSLLGTLALLTSGAPGRRDPGRALAWARRAVESAGAKDADSLAILAGIEFAAGEPDGPARAIRTLEEALDLRGSAPWHRRLLDRLRRTEWPLLPSFASIDAALASLPDAGEIREELLRSLESSASAGGAEALLPYLEGRLLEVDGSPAEALEAFRRAAALDPGRPEPLLRIAGCLGRTGDASGAERFLREALRENPALPREVWERWAALSLAGLAPRDALGLLPPGMAEGPPVSSPAEDLRWLLERLAGGEAVRIDCGSREEVRGAGGEIWGPDRFYRGGRRTTPWFWGWYYSDRIEGTEDDAIYRTFRWFPAEEVEGGYRIPLPPGRYRIALHFAEIAPSKIGEYSGDISWIERQADGRRRFDVRVEGKTAVEDFEPIGPGFATATAKVLVEEVADRILEIGFVPRAGDPLISAIEIEQVE